jgi:hypothetical protein
LITSSPVNHGSQTTSTDFRNKIGPSRHLRRATIQLLSVEADTGPLYEYAA